MKQRVEVASPKAAIGSGERRLGQLWGLCLGTQQEDGKFTRSWSGPTRRGSKKAMIPEQRARLDRWSRVRRTWPSCLRVGPDCPGRAELFCVGKSGR